MTLLVTGGAGFIGSHFIRDWLSLNNEPVVNLDCMTYAANPNNLSQLNNDSRYYFIRGSISDRTLVRDILSSYNIRAVVHFAAETHVDRSIMRPGTFVDTNIGGSFSLLETLFSWWKKLDYPEKNMFRLLHVSTDEVYGSLDEAAAPFSEKSPYCPNSPYAASKAAADHLVRAFYKTWNFPVVITHCSNNYGPNQHLEKLIPLSITNALYGKELPVYGDGQHKRDWLYVNDHCHAIRLVLSSSAPGETWNIGGSEEKTNLEVVETICTILDRLIPRPQGRSYRELITFVPDRPGHDRRYAIDAGKMTAELGWRPQESFVSGIEKTVQWYLDHPMWTNSGLSVHDDAVMG